MAIDFDSYESVCIKYLYERAVKRIDTYIPVKNIVDALVNLPLWTAQIRMSGEDFLSYLKVLILHDKFGKPMSDLFNTSLGLITPTTNPPLLYEFEQKDVSNRNSGVLYELDEFLSTLSVSFSVQLEIQFCGLFYTNKNQGKSFEFCIGLREIKLDGACRDTNTDRCNWLKILTSSGFQYDLTVFLPNTMRNGFFNDSHIIFAMNGYCDDGLYKK